MKGMDVDFERFEDIEAWRHDLRKAGVKGTKCKTHHT